MSTSSSLIPLSNTGLTAFWTCEQLWWWKYKEMLEPRSTTPDMVVGGLVHKAMEVIEQGTEVALDVVMQADALEPQKTEAFAALRALVPTYKNLLASHTPLAHEAWFEAPIPNPNPNHPDYAISRVRIDGLVMGVLGTYLLEFKTTKSLGPYYEQRLRSGPQPLQYMYTVDHVLHNVMGVITLVVVRTKQITVQRLDALKVQPEINRWVKAAGHAASRIHALSTGEALPAMNVDKCFSFYGTCPYLPLCQTNTPAAREMLTASLFQPRISPNPLEREARS